MRRKLPFLCGIMLFLVIKDASGDCNKALGMKNGHIKGDQISASSSISFRMAARKAGTDGWCARIADDKNPYLQVDLLSPHTITKLKLQGAYSSWIQQFSLSFSYDTVQWFQYTVDGKVKGFKGNTNAMVSEVRYLPNPLTARAIRIHAIVLDKTLGVCSKLELYGCQPTENCSSPVGVEDRRITNQQITASSHWNQHYASNARLHNQPTTDSSGTEVWGGWCTDKADKSQFLQVDLGRVRSVSGVATQGYMWEQFVSEYKVNYSTDGQTWQSYRDGSGDSKIFQGNWDNDTVIKKMFARRILARYIRFNPIAWNDNGYICMRVEVYECLPTKGSVPSVSPPSETVELNRTSSVNLTCMVSGQAGLKMVWLKNGVSSLPQSDIYRSQYANGSVMSLLTLKHVKYKDRGTVFSCTAWYSSLSINSTRNVHLLVHAPRPIIKIAVTKARSVTLRVTDPTPDETAKYRVRVKRSNQHSAWSEVLQAKTNFDSVTMLTLNGLLPYMKYIVEVASYYKDGDIGPNSLPFRFTTHQAAPSGPPRDIVIIPHGKHTMKVSWFAPSYEECNGVITKYEVMYKENAGNEQFLQTKGLSKDITGLKDGGQYQLAVRAYTKVGPGPYSSYQTFFTAHPNKGSEITAALEKLNRVKVTDTNAMKVMVEVRNITSKSSKLVEKDIAITANILNKVVKTNRTSSDVGDQVLHTISHVMDAKGEILKKTQRKYNTTAKFVQILEEYIDKGGQFSKGTPNVAVHREIIPKDSKKIVTSVQTTRDQITFNTTANITNMSASEATLTVPSSVLPANDSRNSTLIVVYYRTSRLFAPDFRKTEVCEESFTKETVQKINPPLASSYTMENSSGDLITESSPVLAASLKNKQVVNLTKPIIIEFKMPREKNNNEENASYLQIVRNSTRCVWWDFKKGGWSTSGCALRGIVNDTIICECNHMTNFAALVDVDGHATKVCGKHSMVLSLISYIGCALSIIGLALTIFTYGFFKKLRKDIAAKILLQLCTSLLCVLIVFVSGVDRGSLSEDACRIVAVLVHYFLLVAFLWMLIEAYFMYLAFVKVWRDHGDNVMWKCAAFGWGLPILVVIITLSVDHNSYGGRHYCRLGDVAFFAAFMAPVLFVIVVNTLTFLLIMYKLSTRPANSADRGREGLLRIKRAFGILILVGITWVFGFMAVSHARLVFQYLFAIFNCLQGFAIFMFYCVIQKNVRECWWALVRCDLRSLQKSKSLFTDSYDRRRLSSASRAQNDAMRARTNTALSQVLQLPMRDVTQHQSKAKESVTDSQYHNNVADENDKAQPVTILLDSSDYQMCDLSDSEIMEANGSGNELSIGLSCWSGSRSPSLRSHEVPVNRSHNSSLRGSRNTVNSVQSTPKGLRLPRIRGLYSAGTLKWSRDNIPVKETLKRTASHTPEVPRPLSPCICLRRTKSASSLSDEKRFSGDASLCSDQTSCESLSSEAPTPTRKMICLPVESHGAHIVSPFRGSVRGIVGYVETAVENFDLLIDFQRKKSISSPVKCPDSVPS